MVNVDQSVSGARRNVEKAKSWSFIAEGCIVVSKYTMFFKSCENFYLMTTDGWIDGRTHTAIIVHTCESKMYKCAKGSLTVWALYAYFSDSQNAAFELLVWCM